MQTTNQKLVESIETDLILGLDNRKHKLHNIKIHSLQMKDENLIGILDRVSTISLNDIGKMSGSQR